MTLESVREVKIELARRFPPTIPRSVTASFAFGVGPAEGEIRTAAPASIALGASKTSQGDYRLAVRVQDPAFMTEEVLEPIRRVARSEVEVVYIGEIEALSAVPGGNLWQRGMCWPLRIGCSIGHHATTAGTLGLFVRDQLERLCILSNNHVLAWENQAVIGDAILQPGPHDGGTHPASSVAALSQFIALTAAGNQVDAAVATLSPDSRQNGSDVDGRLNLTGGTALADIGDEVVKMGRTTGFTTGVVRAIEVDNVVVKYPSLGLCAFDRQIEVEGGGDGPFARGGDSGSAILHGNGDVVGLLFAGGNQGGANGRGITYANDIAAVLQALNLTLEVTVSP